MTEKRITLGFDGFDVLTDDDAPAGLALRVNFKTNEPEPDNLTFHTTVEKMWDLYEKLAEVFAPNPHVDPPGKLRVGMKVVALQGERGDDWTMYIGPSTDTETRVAHWGTKLPESVAKALAYEAQFPIDERLERFLDMTYRP